MGHGANHLVGKSIVQRYIEVNSDGQDPTKQGGESYLLETYLT